MKSLIVFALVGLNFTANAHAVVLGPAVLTAEIGHQFTQSNEEISGGTVSINLSDKEVTVTASRAQHCPPGRFCNMMMLAPISIDLPLIGITKNNCGATVYTARQDARTTDGSLEVLQIVDNSTNQCRTMVALPFTTINYSTSYTDRSNGKEITSELGLIALKLTEILY